MVRYMAGLCVFSQMAVAICRPGHGVDLWGAMGGGVRTNSPRFRTPLRAPLITGVRGREDILHNCLCLILPVCRINMFS